MRSFLALLSLVLIASISFAGDNKVTMTSKSIEIATDLFVKNHKEDIGNFTGVKGWPDGENILVKVYLLNNQTVSYTCMVMDGSLMCHGF